MPQQKLVAKISIVIVIAIETRFQSEIHEIKETEPDECVVLRKINRNT